MNGGGLQAHNLSAFLYFLSQFFSANIKLLYLSKKNNYITKIFYKKKLFTWNTDLSIKNQY